MTDLDRLDTLAAKATPGPWHGDDPEPHYGEFGWYVSGCPAGETVDSEQGRADAAYIAAVSPDVVQPLVARVRAAEAALRQLRYEFQTSRDVNPALMDMWAATVDAALATAQGGEK